MSGRRLISLGDAAALIGVNPSAFRWMLDNPKTEVPLSACLIQISPTTWRANAALIEVWARSGGKQAAFDAHYAAPLTFAELMEGQTKGPTLE
jgi:hypothetical protein